MTSGPGDEPTRDAARDVTPAALFAEEGVVREYAAFDFVLPPERTMLSRVAARGGGWRLLDVGVGAGRTTAHLAPLVREYAGLDYSGAMVRACRERFPERAGAFVQGDARALAFADDAFDAVVFSFNGIDTVGTPADRSATLCELDRVCRPGGFLALSSHNLLWLRREASLGHALARTRSGQGPWRRRLRRALRRRAVLRRRNPAAVLRRRLAVVLEERPPYELERSHHERPDELVRVRRHSVVPAHQVALLEGLGRGPVTLLGTDGTDLTRARPGELARHQWIHYLCGPDLHGPAEGT